jgi:hypothetical protein
MEDAVIRCHNCGTKIKIIYIQNGGVVGDCRPCDRIQWIIGPTMGKLIDIKYSSEQNAISNKELLKLLERSEEMKGLKKTKKAPKKGQKKSAKDVQPSKTV